MAKAEKKGQRTIDIYAFFFSLVVFLFIMQLGSGLMGSLSGYSFPGNLTSVIGVWNYLGYIFGMTMMLLAASQAGFVVIRKAQATTRIFAFFDIIVTAIMVITSAYIVLLYKNPVYTIPCVVVILTSLFSLRHVNENRFDLIKKTKAYANEQKRKEKKKLGR